MSEAGSAFFEPTFNRSVKIRARDQRLSSDGGVLLLREVDERLGLVDSIAGQLFDPRCQELIRYHLDELLRERIFSRTLGYNVDDEVDLLAHDPAMRIATWNRPGEQVLDERCASQPCSPPGPLGLLCPVLRQALWSDLAGLRICGCRGSWKESRDPRKGQSRPDSR